MILMYLMIFIMSFVFILMNLIISMNSLLFDKNKTSSPFECGFNPMNSSRLTFSIQFFLISILFLVFDIEIIIMLPIPITMIKSLTFMFTSMSIIFILMLGLFFEWYMGSLKWK